MKKSENYMSGETASGCRTPDGENGIAPLLKVGETVDELGNGLKIIQNPSLYRFTSDSVLLSRFAQLKRGCKVADFCSGSGIVGLNAFSLNPEIDLYMFEMQPALCDMSLRSIELNGIGGRVRAVNCKVQEIGAEFNGFFDAVMCNPPYLKREDGESCADLNIAACKKEIFLTFEELAAAVSKKLKFGGRFYLCHRCERLAEVIYCLKCAAIEPKRVKFIAAKRGEAPYLFLMEGVRGGRAGFKVEKEGVNDAVYSFDADRQSQGHNA